MNIFVYLVLSFATYAKKAGSDVKPGINFTERTLMSLREIDLRPETYYDCENGVYDLFTHWCRYRLQTLLSTVTTTGAYANITKNTLEKPNVV